MENFDMLGWKTVTTILQSIFVFYVYLSLSIRSLHGFPPAKKVEEEMLGADPWMASPVWGRPSTSHMGVVQSFSEEAVVCSVGLCQTSTSRQRNGVQWFSKAFLERAQFIFVASMYFSNVVNQMFSASPARFWLKNVMLKNQKYVSICYKHPSNSVFKYSAL